MEAWKIYKENKGKIEITVIVSGVCIGSNLHKRLYIGSRYAQSVLTDELKMVPQYKEGMVDVRDVADAHYKGMVNSKADGERFIVTTGTYKFMEVVNIVEQMYKFKGYSIWKWTMNYAIF